MKEALHSQITRNTKICEYFVEKTYFKIINKKLILELCTALSVRK